MHWTEYKFVNLDKNSNFLFISFCTFLFTQIIFYIYFGTIYNIPFYGSDTIRFIDGSNKLQNLDFESLQKSWGYLTYIFLFFITDTLFNSNYNLIMYFQIFASYISSIFLFFLAKKIYNLFSAYLVFFLYIGYLDIQRWNFIMYSDSLFVSLLIILLYFLINIKNIKDIAIMIPIVIVTVCCRPHGILLFLPIIITCLFLLKFNIKNILIILLFFSSIVFIIFFKQINIILIDYNEWIKYFTNGQYIAEFKSDITLFINSECLEKNFLRIIFCGIYEEPFKIIKINFLKFFYFFFNIRPYWTNLHIVINLIINSTILIFFIIHVLKYRSGSNYEYIIFSFLIIYCLSIMLTWNDYDGRFFNPIYPFICIFASNAINNMYKYFVSNGK